MTFTDTIAFIDDYCDFSNPNYVWLLKGISRSKDNPAEYDRFFRRMVLSCPEDIETSYNEIKRLGNQNGTVYRIYISLNSRDVVRANFNFAKRLIDITHEVSMGRPDFLAKSKKLGSEWKTELEQKRNRGTKRILLDVDEDSKSFIQKVKQYIAAEMDTKIHVVRKTPNGWAVSIEACDTRGLLAEFKDYEIDIQRDSMIFLEQYAGKEE